MKLLIGLITCIGLFGQANNSPQQSTLVANGPGAVTGVNATVVGNVAQNTLYYWVVPVYPIGQGQISQQMIVSNAPGVLSASNYVRVSWNRAAGATGYFLLKTTTPTIPSTCTCALLGPSNVTTYNDQGAGMAGFSYQPVGTATANITIDNQNYTIPRLLIDTPINPTNFSGLPSAISSNGLVYLVKDALSTNSCVAGGGTNTPALCWSNGTSWVALSGGSGSGTVTQVVMAGTANQISLSGTCTITTTGTCLFFLPTDFRIPGTINKLTLTQPATGASITVLDGITLTVDKSLEFDGTNGVKITFPTSNATVSTLGLTNVFTGRQDATGAASTAPAKTGTSVPGTCTVGDVFFKSDATAGQNLYYCASLNTYTQQLNSGSGGGSVFTGSTALAPVFSATPTFSLADVSVKSPVRFEPGALTANVTAVIFTNKPAGAKFSIAWLQDGTGGRTVAYGASAVNTCVIDPTLSITTTQFFEVAQDGSTVNGVGCTTNNSGVEGGPESIAPGTPTAGNWWCWTDSTNHVRSCKQNGSATVSSMVVPQVCGGGNFFSGLSAAGVLTCTAISSSQIPPVTLPTPGATCSMVGNSTYCICTTTCTVTPLTPIAGSQLCVRNDMGVSTVITLAAVASTYYEKTDNSAYGTVNTVATSSGAVGDKICIVGRDTTHYLTWSSTGGWTVN
jgi:hypothetical protein